MDAQCLFSFGRAFAAVNFYMTDLFSCYAVLGCETSARYM
jgi:hypothetical protein